MKTTLSLLAASSIAIFASAPTAQAQELDAAAIAGPGDNAISRAAWTLVARALLNLDEIITRD